MLRAINYEVINGGKLTSRPKHNKYYISTEYVDQLTKRAERLWNRTRTPKHQVSLFINYANLNRYNPKIPNIGLHDYELKTWH